MKTLRFFAPLLVALTLGAAAQAGPMYSFTTSPGTQPSNVGTITLTQVNSTTVNLLFDLLPGYGIINTGGPHTPFAFTLAGTAAGLSVNFLNPAGGALRHRHGPRDVQF